MANTIISSTNIVINTKGNRINVRKDNDDIYVLNITNPSGVAESLEMWRSVDGGSTFVLQDSGGEPILSFPITTACMAIDSAGIIHVLYYDLDDPAMQADPQVSYASFSTVTNLWVIINEQVANLTDAAGDFGFAKALAIAIDANDIPHGVWNDEVNDMGSPIPRVFYSNRISGSWKGRVEVRQKAVNISFPHLDLIIAQPTNAIGADRPIVISNEDTVGQLNLSAFHGNALDATTFVVGLNFQGGEAVLPNEFSLSIDNNNDLQVSWVENVSLDLKMSRHLATESNIGIWVAPVTIDIARDYLNPSIATDFDNIYIYVESSADNDIRLWKDVGAGFVEETADPDLPNVGTFQDVRVKYSSKNNNSPRELDYVFFSATEIIFNTFQGEAPPVAPAGAAESGTIGNMIFGLLFGLMNLVTFYNRLFE